jgi:uncharacterized protein
MELLRRTVLAVLMLLAGAGLAQAQERSAWIVTVTGEGTATAVPDVAELRAGVITQGKTAREASEANGRTMTALLALLKTNGIPDTDVQTSRFSIQPVYEPNRNPPQRITGFQVANQVTVRIRDLTTIGDMIDKLVGAGPNDFSGISFQVSGASAALDTARVEAIADARRKADIYARAAGLNLGRAISIVEEGSAAPVRVSAMAARQGTPIAPGQETLRVGVTVTFELLR